jgi:hypothetical protein
MNTVIDGGGILYLLNGCNSGLSLHEIFIHEGVSCPSALVLLSIAS